MNEIVVTKNGTEVFKHNITAMNYTERFSVQLEGGWANVQLEKGVVYNVTVHAEGVDDVSFVALYDGYWYNAMLDGSSGGLMVTNNSIQFSILG